MSEEEQQSELDIALDPAVAFEGMRRQLALLSAAVEGFAARQQVIEARDYAPDIAKLIDRQDKVREAILKLADRPGVALTPTGLVDEISRAASAARKADHDFIRETGNQQAQAMKALETAIGTFRAREEQRKALIVAATAGGTLVLLLWLATILLR